MKPNLNNVSLLCDQHAPKPGYFTHHDPHRFVGCFVKKMFLSLQGHKEHMWVQITDVVDKDKNELTGKLANAPVYATQYEFMSTVIVKTSEIEMVISETENLFS